MIDDQNKTELTRKVTAAVSRYLDERGCKPLETEVYVCDGWIADIAGVLSPTTTELIALKLIPRKPNYKSPGYQEWFRMAKEAKALMTVLVEVKTSVSDFSKDRKWLLPSPTNLSYLAIPTELTIPVDKLQGWGVLQYSSVADYVKLSKVPIVKDVSTQQQLSVVLQIAYRRDNHTRYERHREFQRNHRSERNEYTTATRMTKAMMAMCAIIEGRYDSAQTCLEYYGIKTLPKHQIEELQTFWGQHSQSINRIFTKGRQ